MFLKAYFSDLSSKSLLIPLRSNFSKKSCTEEAEIFDHHHLLTNDSKRKFMKENPKSGVLASQKYWY